jgi:hypothetical protein
VFLLNSRSHLVSAAFPSSLCKTTHQKRRTFSRSYGTILPSSFTRVLSSALVCSTCPPVSVCGTVFYKLWLAAFPGSRASITSSRLASQHHLAPQSYSKPDLPSLHPYMQVPGLPTPGSSSLLRPYITTYKKSRNINLVSIDYALQPRLRGRLTLLRLTSCRNPGTFGVWASHPHYRYSCQHSHF